MAKCELALITVEANMGSYFARKKKFKYFIPYNFSKTFFFLKPAFILYFRQWTFMVTWQVFIDLFKINGEYHDYRDQLG